MKLKVDGNKYPGEARKLTEFNDIYLLNHTLHIDDRGELYEVLHDYDFVKYGNGRFGQVYVVVNPSRETVRAYHRHNELWDYFTIVAGSAKFVLVNPSGTSAREVVLSASRPQTLVIPPKCWHGWMSLEDYTILLCVGSEIYNRSNPDEERVPPDEFDYVFDGRTPWQVQGR